MAMTDVDRFLDRITGSGRTDLSRRRESAQIAQRQSWGELKPGQRSLNQPGFD